MLDSCGMLFDGEDTSNDAAKLRQVLACKRVMLHSVERRVSSGL